MVADNSLAEGFELMFIGMGAVFTFLLILVGVMNAMGWFFAKYDHLFPDAEQEITPPPSPMAKIAAAIAIAHSRKHTK